MTQRKAVQAPRWAHHSLPFEFERKTFDSPFKLLTVLKKNVLTQELSQKKQNEEGFVSAPFYHHAKNHYEFQILEH